MPESIPGTLKIEVNTRPLDMVEKLLMASGIFAIGQTFAWMFGAEQLQHLLQLGMLCMVSLGLVMQFGFAKMFLCSIAPEGMHLARMKQSLPWPAIASIEKRMVYTPDFKTRYMALVVIPVQERLNTKQKLFFRKQIILRFLDADKTDEDILAAIAPYHPITVID